MEVQRPYCNPEAADPYGRADDKDSRMWMGPGTSHIWMSFSETNKPLHVFATVPWVFFDLQSNSVLTDIDGEQEKAVNITVPGAPQEKHEELHRNLDSKRLERTGRKMGWNPHGGQCPEVQPSPLLKSRTLHQAQSRQVKDTEPSPVPTSMDLLSSATRGCSGTWWLRKEGAGRGSRSLGRSLDRKQGLCGVVLGPRFATDPSLCK